MNLITGPEVEAYLYGMLPPRLPVLAEMERQAAARDIPIVGPAVGRLLQLLAATSGARRIFEFGSAIGYSTLWWALGAGDGAEVHYTELSPTLAAEAEGYFRQSGLAERIRMGAGDAMAYFDATAGDFDLIFIDLDKELYLTALDRALPRLRPGGLLVADNTLWSGRVATPDDSAATRTVVEFNRRVYADPNLFPVILPLRDGVLVCRKNACRKNSK